MKRLLKFFGLFASFSLLQNSYSCTRVLDNTDSLGPVVGRNEDWFQDMFTDFVIFPRGVVHRENVKGEALSWTSKYGSLVSTVYDLPLGDGLNEKGLSAHILALNSDYGARDESRPGVLISEWLQFYVDNFATVDEAVAFTKKHDFQLVDNLPEVVPGQKTNIHLAIEDATGDSAIFEYEKGHVTISQSRKYLVMTNDPVYHDQVKNLKRYTGFGGTLSIPGSSGSSDRFVRASYDVNYGAPVTSSSLKVRKMFLTMGHAVQPMHAQARMSTLWTSVTDLKNLRYYFHSNDRLNTIYVDLNQFHFDDPHLQLQKLDLASHSDNPEFSGEVSGFFVPFS